jgi:hypothetical protein
LTKRALRQLNRRKIQAAPNPPRSPHRRAPQSITRKLFDGSKRNRQIAQSIADYLPSCEPRILKDIRYLLGTAVKFWRTWGTYVLRDTAGLHQSR